MRMPLACAMLLGWRTLRCRLVVFFWSSYYNCYLRMHPGVHLRGWITVTGRVAWKIDPRARVEISPGVRINSGYLLNGFGGHRIAIVWVLSGGQLILGESSGFSSSTIVCAQAVTVGPRVMIGGACDIFDTDFHPLELEERIGHRSAGRTAPIDIKEGAFIGGRTIIMKGVSVGERAVVGAGSVVTKAVPPGEIWAGNPARMIGTLPDARSD